MTQEERLDWLISYLARERGPYQGVPLPKQLAEKRQLFRALQNIRPPAPVSTEFLQIQDAYLQAERVAKGITRLEDLTPVRPGIYLWQGDITTLAVDAIVNAANSQLLGCFVPCHKCIDNAIHSAAGMQLRAECSQLMGAQGHEEPIGSAKLTKAYNLPCRYVLHTVGPIIHGTVTKSDCDRLASCYRACLDLAMQNGIKSIAFCCISTGEFHFPNRRAAEIAVSTVEEYNSRSHRPLEVIFNVFQDVDLHIYRELLGAN